MRVDLGLKHGELRFALLRLFHRDLRHHPFNAFEHLVEHFAQMADFITAPDVGADGQIAGFYPRRNLPKLDHRLGELSHHINKQNEEQQHRRDLMQSLVCTRYESG